MELRFRPKDPYCHPVFGDQQVTSSLLLRVSVPKNQLTTSSTTSATAPNAKAEVVGIIETSVRFKGKKNNYLRQMNKLSNTM